MIKKYINERRSWIILFISLQCLTIFIAYLDPLIPLKSALYLIFLACIIITVFFAIRYKKESKFYKNLDEMDMHLDLNNLIDATSPFEKIVEDSLHNQTERLKLEAAEHRGVIEEEKDELLSWIHEVKTPLTAMHLMIDRLENQEIKKQLMFEWLRIHLLLDQQLHQQRIPSMKNDLFMESVSIQSILTSEIKTLRSLCMQKGIGFDLQLEVLEVLSDAKWLSFILRQILTNAVKYSEKSEITIKSFILHGQISLEIMDQGRGIDAKDLPRIFDRGFTSTKNHQDSASTGMGLYLAKKTADNLHIQIDVHSKLGKGTMFSLTFPNKNEFIRITGM